MIQTVDFLILDLIQNKLRCKFLDSLMVKFSSLGDGGIVWIAISFLLICYKKYRQAGILILVGLIMGVLIGNCLLKNIICRPRPCWINRAVSLLIPIPYDYSFPSCHTMSSFIAAAVLLHTDIMFAYPAFLLASVIAFSRLYKIISVRSLSVRYYRRNCVRYNYRTLRMLIIARFQTISHRAAEQLK